MGHNSPGVLSNRPAKIEQKEVTPFPSGRRRPSSGLSNDSTRYGIRMPARNVQTCSRLQARKCASSCTEEKILRCTEPSSKLVRQVTHMQMVAAGSVYSCTEKLLALGCQPVLCSKTLVKFWFDTRTEHACMVEFAGQGSRVCLNNLRGIEYPSSVMV